MPKKRNKDWSAAGAARAAREARIATTQFQRHAPIARLWQMNKLLWSFQIYSAKAGDDASAAAALFSGMGYRPPFPRDTAEAADVVLADEARCLSSADLYVVSPQMCDVVIAAARSLTRADLAFMNRDDLPSRTGMVVLPSPILVRTVDGGLADDRAFTWHTPAQLSQRDVYGDSWHDLPAVRQSVYHDTHGPLQPDSFRDYAARASALGTPLPPLQLDSVRCVPLYHVPTGRESTALREFGLAARELTRAARSATPLPAGTTTV